MSIEHLGYWPIVRQLLQRKEDRRQPLNGLESGKHGSLVSRAIVAWQEVADQTGRAAS